MINTLRFDEFLLAEERKAALEAELDRQAAIEFSWRTDASYEPLVDGLALKRQRPDNVPELTLNGLPGYETTSDEDEHDLDGGMS